ncbi:MAG: peptidylprolyl isomerase [Acidobacteria bacterium]|nr:peptidylprolyl isomerase [Acidobacteriota bacterium]
MTRIFALILTLVLAACSSDTPVEPLNDSAAGAAASEGADASQTPAEPARPVPAQLPEVVAYVNGEPITGNDVERGISELEARAGQPVPPGQRDQVVRDVLDQLIAYRLLIQETQERRTSVPEADVDARIAALRAQFPSDEAFSETLQLRQMTLAMLRSEARQSLQVDALLESELSEGPPVTVEEIATFYEENPADFQQDEQVRASHILLGFPEDADEATKNEVRTRAAEVLNLVKTGADFAGTARQYSDDPGSRPNGGDLGFFQRGQMVPTFEEAAFALRPAGISDLVESPFGYHIIQVTERMPPRTIPLAEVRQEVQLFLEGRNRDLRMQALVDSLREESQVDIYI